MELKTCPFCGGEADTLIVPDLTYVFCRDCCVEISRRWSDCEYDNPRTTTGDPKMAAIEAWNRRVDNG